MAHFRLFPRDRKPSLGELLGSSQAERQVSRKHTLRIVHDPLPPLKNAERQAERLHRADEARALPGPTARLEHGQLSVSLLCRAEALRLVHQQRPVDALEHLQESVVTVRLR
jgi:hypothetical protein